MDIIFIIIILLGTYSSISILYNLILLFAHFLIKDIYSPLLAPKTKFSIVIPAHNEELFLGRLLKSIQKQNYPLDMFETIVVADNCTDKTAQIGLENNTTVLERFDNQYRGKGYAIKYALERIDVNNYDALFIIDADSIINNDVLGRLNQAILRGNTIIQCYNGVANPDESWFTRLLDVSRTIGNEIYHPAKQKLGLSSYLMGNGMCFSRKILLKYGWYAFTIGEDWEYYATLVQNGETIAFANKARVYHQESSSLKQATSQRMRWSSGRFAVAWNYGLKLFYRGLIERNIRKLDASLPLILPNPSMGMNITIVGLLLSLLLPVAMSRNNFIFCFSFLILVQFLIFMIGILYTGKKMNNFLSLFVAPLFLIWKMGIDTISALGMCKEGWVRTERRL
jgi:cellulose synthase/poly-beta-1,6-N-acetylglucosamine synthase-like glycosyltransferase